MDFYNMLMGKVEGGLDGTYIVVLREGPQLSNDKMDSLTAPITEKEIEIDLNGISDLKAPGLDGYGACFFKKAWSIVKHDLMEVVYVFFMNGKLYKATNCTMVTLIPKSREAKTIREYLPIFYCNTVYKIISKIMTDRMRKMLSSTIDQNQAAFIPGQVIHNHILLTYELLKGYKMK